MILEIITDILEQHKVQWELLLTNDFKIYNSYIGIDGVTSNTEIEYYYKKDLKSFFYLNINDPDFISKLHNLLETLKLYQ